MGDLKRIFGAMKEVGISNEIGIMLNLIGMNMHPILILQEPQGITV